ncbi:hypothetical protein BBO99_00007763 [Phytophthora kernoviae]|uniref:PDZ domain-containing protein n=2 Tax=Phytophthora kernoviae TaxID=325452 RepID=A0A421FAD7_9STRA|nr:hypothetical protein G195_006181 [Phytophthora kernoviae 00238/432]KAG2518196.1 hypothetical protein JM16_005398 [Phytophthora kernoviae]KAG2520037.1 hypothetical protein JM18_007353 [Phytophthora kernoviae]RLN32520.1 hypothetical protein BBI17_007689 [Phytophthora kernoviae]RLN76156.1 hypothetical protein BBO99_00007763 [Phytophthora kernoviae]
MGRSDDEVPPLFAMAMRYRIGDDVKTPFGPGHVRSCSDRKTHVEVELAGGGVLYAKRGCLLPELRMLQCGEIPKHTRVLLLSSEGGEEGDVLNYIVSDQKYQVFVDGEVAAEEDQEAADQKTKRFSKEDLRLAKDTRVRTIFGLGSITDYRKKNDSYAVQLDCGSVGFFQAKDVSCVDLRLLSKIPKPLSAERIYDEFQGRITHDDALMLSRKAKQTYHQGQTLMKKAKALVESVENPDEFCSNVTKAISEVKLDKLTEWGSTLSKNREKRQAFVNRMKDHCLDFFTSVLPTIKVDTISGVQDDIGYSISKLDLSNFRVKKERVKVRMGTVVDEELLTVRATHLTALLKGFDWTFEQKYFPYLHGGGVADAELSGGVISLGFKAEKKVVNEETGEFKPILVLNSMTIEIRQELKLTVQGSWFSAVYNMLTSLFAELIREYLAKTMESKLLKHMIKLLGTLNKQMDEYWPLIFQLLDVRMEDLPTASPWRGAKEVEIQPQELECIFTERNTVPFTFSKGVLNKYVVVARVLDFEAPSNSGEAEDNHDFHLTSDLKRVPVGSSVLAINGLCCSKLTLEELMALLDTLPLPFTIRFSLLPEDPAKNRQQNMKPQPEIASFTFRQEGPFGLRLRTRPLASCGVIVVGFSTPSKSDGKKCAAELSGKIRVGQLLMKVNNVDLRFKSLSEVLNILRDLKSRPVTMQFATSPDAIIKLRDWPPMIELEDASSFACDEDDPPSDGRKYTVLSAFTRVPSYAQRTHLVEKSDVLLHVNGVPMASPDYSSFAQIMEALREVASRKEPMRAVFVSREHYVTIRKQIQQHGLFSRKPEDNPMKGEVEGGPDQNNEVNGGNENVSDVTSPATAKDIGELLSSIPTKEIVFPKAPLGILFGNWKDEAIYIRAFISSPGPAEKTGLLRPGQAVLQVCGHAVPREATLAIIEEMILKVTLESRAPPAPPDNNIDTNTTAEVRSNDKKPKYTLTVRDLELEQELMK